MKKILITGGAGFIGKRLIELICLTKDRYEITVLDSLDKQIHGHNPDMDFIQKHSRFVHGDIRDVELVNSLVGDCEKVIHLAAQTGTGQSMYQVSSYTDVNCMGTAILMEAILANRSNISKVLVASSRAVYGEGKYQCPTHGVQYPGHRNDEEMKKKIYDPVCPECKLPLKPMPTDENSPIKPASVYGLSKYYQEELVKTTCASISIPFTSLRFQNVYGAGQSLNNPYTGILSIFSNLILNDREINVFEDGLESRDFIYVDDVCYAIITSINSEQANNRIFNVGSGNATTVLEVVELLYKIYQKQPRFLISGNYRVGDIRHNFADISAICQKLSFSPRINLETGIKKLADWVLQQPINSVAYDRSIAEMKDRKLYK